MRFLSRTVCGYYSYYCVEPPYGLGANAFVEKKTNIITICPRFFAMPRLFQGCFVPIQSSTYFHETTHTMDVGPTEDFDVYGKSFPKTVRRYIYLTFQGINDLLNLAGDQNLRHADTYAHFAMAAMWDC